MNQAALGFGQPDGEDAAPRILHRLAPLFSVCFHASSLVQGDADFNPFL
jgi:hypothetical protein